MVNASQNEALSKPVGYHGTRGKALKREYQEQERENSRDRSNVSYNVAKFMYAQGIVVVLCASLQQREVED